MQQDSRLTGPGDPGTTRSDQQPTAATALADRGRHDQCSTSKLRRSAGAGVLAGVLLLASACTADAEQAPEVTSSGQAVVEINRGTGDPATVGVDADTAFDAATRDDAEFNSQFAHEFAEVDDVRMHYVTGGEGPPLVLLHGWPQSWYAWRDVMPALAQEFTVYAVDLPGLGDSEGAPSGYDKATLARYVHGLVTDELGLGGVNLVGHDLGAGVGFQYAAQFPDGVTRYAHLDYPLPGPALSAQEYRSFSWHIAFHQQERFPETVVADDVESYLELFYPYVAYGGESFGGQVAESPFSEAEVDEFARTYSRPDVLAGGFELYRTLEQDEADNTAAGPVAVPTMLITAEGGLESTLPTVAPLLSSITREVEVPGAGHWLMTENPDLVTTELLAFFTD